MSVPWAGLSALSAGFFLLARRRLLQAPLPEPPGASLFPTPAAITAAETRATVVWTTGRTAHYDPWTQRLTLGDQWRSDTLLARHVAAHECVHAGQPRRWALWASRPGAVAFVSAVVAGCFWPPPLNLLVVLAFMGIWGTFSLWPLETAADAEATRRLSGWAHARLGTEAAKAVTVWADALARRHRWTLMLEWGAMAASGLVAMFVGR